MEEAVSNRIKRLEKASGFRLLFAPKVRKNKGLPAHRDWVKIVFLPRLEKALSRVERVLETMACT